MARQSRMIMMRTAEAPKSCPSRPDRLEAADSAAREVFVAAVDAMPGGRRSMGLHAHRVNKAAVGTYTPRAADFLMAVERGANPALFALHFAAFADLLMGTLPTDARGCYPTTVREVGEAVAAGAEWMSAPTPANGRAARKEIAEAVTHLRLLDSTVAAESWRAARSGSAR